MVENRHHEAGLLGGREAGEDEVAVVAEGELDAPGGRVGEEDEFFLEGATAELHANGAEVEVTAG